MVYTIAFGQGHALLRECLWKRDSQLWGMANLLTSGEMTKVVRGDYFIENMFTQFVNVIRYLILIWSHT